MSAEYLLISSAVAMCVELSSDEVEESCGVGLIILVHRLQKIGVVEGRGGWGWLTFFMRCLYFEEAMNQRKHCQI